MIHVTLINPNTSMATTAMMTDIARKYLPAGVVAEGITAADGVPMILDEKQLAAASAGVIENGLAKAGQTDGLIIGAFGDPGLERLREISDIPVVGICEASMYEAGRGGRRFGIATVTPHLIGSFSRKAERLGLSSLFTGTRLTPGDPMVLTCDPQRLHAALAAAVRDCFEKDGAEAVIIGGGPLGQAADDLQRQLSAPVIAPIRSAVGRLMSRIAEPPPRAAMP